ncbi:MAG: nuclear transport factor 2 family protein [Bacteroidota bacterium]
MKTIYIFATALLLTVGCNRSRIGSKANTSDSSNAIQLVSKGLNAVFRDYSPAGMEKYFTENYIQHNPGIPTGRAPLIGFLPALKEAGTTQKTHRVFQDGDFVVTHNTYDNAQAFGAKEIVTFDVFRVEKGRLAEHWDAIQPRVVTTKSGRSQVDGPKEVKDLAKTEENKALIKVFMSDILLGENPQKLTDYISAETYHQHNPGIGDGLAGLQAAFGALAAKNDMFVYHKVHKILGQGNFVLTMSEGEWHGKPHAFYDLFRIESGLLVEHWDVIQEIPAEMAHENGMF